MKYYKLDKEEKEIGDAFDKGKLRRAKDARRDILRYRSYARGTLGRTRNINIRVSERDLQKLKARAAAKGMPYQTLVSSILHQYNTSE